MNIKNTWPRDHKGQTAYHASCQSKPCTRPVLHSHLRLLMKWGSSCSSVNHCQSKQREEDDWICWVKRGKKGRYIRLWLTENVTSFAVNLRKAKSQFSSMFRERDVCFSFLIKRETRRVGKLETAETLMIRPYRCWYLCTFCPHWLLILHLQVAYMFLQSLEYCSSRWFSNKRLDEKSSAVIAFMKPTDNSSFWWCNLLFFKVVLIEAVQRLNLRQRFITNVWLTPEAYMVLLTLNRAPEGVRNKRRWL